MVLTSMVVSVGVAVVLLLFGFAFSRRVFKEEDNFYHHIISGLNLTSCMIAFPALIIGTIFEGIKAYFILLMIGFALFIIHFLLKDRLFHRFEVLTPQNLAIIAFVSIVLIRHLFLLCGGGILAWDSLWGYLPWARQFCQLDRIPLYDAQRPGFAITKPPLMMLLYSFSYTFAPELEVSTAFSLLFLLGLGVLAGQFVRKETKSYALSALAVIMTMSIPIYDYFSYRWGAYLDLPFGFFYLSSVYFLIETLEKGGERNRLLFWVSFSLALLTKETMLIFAFTYFVILAYYCRENLILILLANLVPIGHIFLALLDVISFDWAPLGWVMLSSSLLISAQFIMGIENRSQYNFADVFKTLFDKSCFLIGVPIFWYVRLYFLGLLPEILSGRLILGIFAVLLLLVIYVLSRRRSVPHIEKKRTIKAVYSITRIVVLFLVIASVVVFFTYPGIVTPENLTFTPLAPVIYAFLSGWFAFAYIIPKTYGFFKGIVTRGKERIYSCLTFCLLAAWSIVGLTSIRYIAFIVPLLTLFTIKGLSCVGNVKTIENSGLLFAAIAFLSVLVSSLHYESTTYPKLVFRLWQDDLLRNGLMALIGILISISFTLVVSLISNTRTRATVRITSPHAPKITLISKGLVIFILVLVVAKPILSPLQDLHSMYESRLNYFNMGYAPLLQDLAFRYDSDGTILTPIPTAGTTYWSQFSIINLNNKEQNRLLNLHEILASNNLTALFDFYRRHMVKFIILPKKTNWYYKTVDERFIHQPEWLQGYYPNIRLILESVEDLSPVDTHSSSSSAIPFTVVNPYDYYDVYLVP